MLTTLFSIWLIAILVMMFFNTKVSLCLYISYFLLLPVMQIDLAGLHLGENFVSFAILFIFFGRNIKNSNRFDLSIFKPFLWLYIFYLAMIPIQTGMPMSTMFNLWRMSMMSYFLLPIVLWNAYRIDPSIFKAIRNTIIICTIIICGYGLYLTTMPGENPWLLLLQGLGLGEFNDEYALDGVDDGRMFGRISSVFFHPMNYGMFLCMAFMFVLANFGKLKWLKIDWSWVLLSLVGLAILTCGVRSIIGGVAAGLAYFFYRQRKLKVLGGALVGYLLLMLVVQYIPGMDDYIGSIVQYDSDKVKGSSFDMRLDQLRGCFYEIRNCTLDGNGFGWTTNYIARHGDHPTILAFESLLYVILCNNGLLGILAWIIMGSAVLLKKWPDKQMDISLKMIFITYVAYASITGDYGYMKFFMLFYAAVTTCLAPQKKLKPKETLSTDTPLNPTE